jgi:hypothetical protein
MEFGFWEPLSEVRLARHYHASLTNAHSRIYSFGYVLPIDYAILILFPIIETRDSCSSNASHNLIHHSTIFGRMGNEYVPSRFHLDGFWPLSSSTGQKIDPLMKLETTLAVFQPL